MLKKIFGACRVLFLIVSTILTFDFPSFALIPMWVSTLNSGRSALKDRIPRLTLGAIGRLNKLLKKEMCVFEYGSGGSTLYFSERVNKVVSIEHDKKWFSLLKKEINQEKNIDYFLIPPGRGKKQGFMSGLKEYKTRNFKNYVTKINDFPDRHFDIVLVDGRARNSCLKIAARKVKKGGFLVLDNSERKEYDIGKKVLSEYKRKDYNTPIPYLANKFGKTTFWEIR